MTPSNRSGEFSERVIIVYATQIMMVAVGIFNAFLLARLLGPTTKGDFYLLRMLPATAMVLLQFGLPQAFAFNAARKQTSGMMGRTVVLTVILSAIGALVLLGLLPFLRESMLGGLEPILVIAVLCVLPILLLRTLASSIVIAVKAVRWFGGVMMVEVITTTVLLILLVGLLGLGLPGALVMFAAPPTIGVIALWIGARRAIARSESEGSVGYLGLLRYGLPLYPASLSSFFSSRADVFLIAALAPDSATALGYYSMSVTLAEMAANLPNAASAVFLPHVAGAAREDADRQVTMLSRGTVLLTVLTALAIAPAGAILISVVLPTFTPALPALYILLPAVVSLAVSKVIGGYVSGLGLTARTSAATVLGFVVNLVANIILIPQYGIVGAAAASLISYTITAVAITLIASRLAGVSLAAFWIPRLADVRYMWAAGTSMLHRIVTRGATLASPEADANDG